VIFLKNNIQPLIKWSGSKRTQAYEIVRTFPCFSTYYEPFLGGGSVLYLTNPKKVICGDICKPLISLWLLVKNNPNELVKSYKNHWDALQKEGYTYYYKVRDAFNEYHSPLDLFFLSRTCVNGLIRFNKKGQFNNSLHHTRKGIHPDRIKKIILIWSEKIQNVEFVEGDYRDTTKSATEEDFIYLDPPYFNTKGRYYGKINFDEFVTYLDDLNKRGIKYALSLDGIRANKIYSIDLPKRLYKQHFLIESGNSPFKKVMDNEIQKVKESLYLNFFSENKPIENYCDKIGSNNLANFKANDVSLKSSE
jgi:DNA adenine methylase